MKATHCVTETSLCFVASISPLLPIKHNRTLNISAFILSGAWGSHPGEQQWQ